MTLPQNEPFSKGISAGLRMALAMLLIFFWLDDQRNVPLSIFLGAIAGLAIGRIVYWWELKDEPAPEKPIEDESLEDVALERKTQKRYYARYRRQRRKQPVAIPDALDRLAFWKR
jgi:hypothetical protein